MAERTTNDQTNDQIQSQPVPQQYFPPFGMPQSTFFGPHFPHFPGLQFPQFLAGQPGFEAGFSSIQALTQTLSSLSMVIESTNATYHSFSRALSDLGQFRSIFDIIRKFYRWLRYMFNLVDKEQIWSDSLEIALSQPQQRHKQSSQHFMPSYFGGGLYGSQYEIGAGLQSIVQLLNSVSMMMESTYAAYQSSSRALSTFLVDRTIGT